MLNLGFCLEDLSTCIDKLGDRIVNGMNYRKQQLDRTTHTSSNAFHQQRKRNSPLSNKKADIFASHQKKVNKILNVFKCSCCSMFLVLFDVF